MNVPLGIAPSPGVRRAHELGAPLARASSKALAFAGALVLALVLCARVDVRSPTSAHAHVFLAQELLLVLGAAALAVVALAARLRVPRDSISCLVALLVAVEIPSVALSADPWLALRSASVWIAGLVVFASARSVGRDAQARGPALAALLVPLGLAAASVILEAMGVVHLSADRHAPGGLTGERNVAAELFVVGAPAVAWAAIVDGPRWRRGAALVVAGLSATAIVLCRTRSAWLAGLVLLAALGFFAFRSAASPRPRARRLAIVIGAGVMVALVIPSSLHWKSAHPYRDTLVHLVDASSASGAGRVVQYATTARMTWAHPLLGVGPGNWAGQYLSFAHPGDPTIHEGLLPVNRLPNGDLLGFAAERGVPAALVLVALVIVLLRSRGPAPALRVVRLATVLAVAIVGALDAVLQTPAALVLVAWTLGICSARVPSDDAKARPLGESLVLGGAFVALVAASAPAALRVASLQVAARARGSEELDRAVALDPGDLGLRLSAAESWIADGRCDRAQAHLEAARRFSPASPAARELTMRCPRE